MVFFQGEWYCMQCGQNYDLHPDTCKLCTNDEFQNEPYVPKDDLDQLTDEQLVLFNYDIGNF